MRDAISRNRRRIRWLRIYILASHEGCYTPYKPSERSSSEFISSHPMRDAMPVLRCRSYVHQIYILASHEGCYARDFSVNRPVADLYPRIPWGMLYPRLREENPLSRFISSHPMRDAILDPRVIGRILVIYILASHEGCYPKTNTIFYIYHPSQANYNLMIYLFYQLATFRYIIAINRFCKQAFTVFNTLYP